MLWLELYNNRRHLFFPQISIFSLRGLSFDVYSPHIASLFKHAIIISRLLLAFYAGSGELHEKAVRLFPIKLDID